MTEATATAPTAAPAPTFRASGPRADGNEKGVYNRALAVANKAKRYATTSHLVRGEVVKTTGNGDAVALALTGHSPEDAVELCEAILIAARVAIPAMGLTAMYAHLNPGMARMNSANRVRGAIRKGKLTEAEVLAHGITEAVAEPTDTPEAPMSLGAGIDALH